MQDASSQGELRSLLAQKAVAFSTRRFMLEMRGVVRDALADNGKASRLRQGPGDDTVGPRTALKQNQIEMGENGARVWAMDPVWSSADSSRPFLSVKAGIPEGATLTAMSENVGYIAMNALQQSELQVAPTYDASEWPLFVVRMPPVALSPEGFQLHLNACREPFRRLEPFAMLINMGQHPPLPATQRKAVSDAMKADNKRYPGVQMGLAIVVRSAFERGIITAISWVASPPYPFAAFGKELEAAEWLIEKLPARDRPARTAQR
jgi:hypothetical protein